MFSNSVNWTKRFRYSFSAWNFVFPVAVGHRFRFRKYSLFLKSVNWHSYRKLFSNAKQTAEVHHGDLNWNRFTELILLQNSKTSCRSSFLFSTNTIWVAKRARLGPVTLKLNFFNFFVIWITDKINSEIWYEYPMCACAHDSQYSFLLSKNKGLVGIFIDYLWIIYQPSLSCTNLI